MKFVLGVKIPVYGSIEDVTVNKPDEIHSTVYMELYSTVYVELYYTVYMEASGIVSHEMPSKKVF